MMKRTCHLLLFLCSLYLCPAFPAPTSSSGAGHRLWFSRPASHWLEALPVGNSHLGAMIYGGVRTERILLNEETFWSGAPHNNNSPAAFAHLQEVRDLIFADREQEAHALLEKHFLRTPFGMRFLPLGELRLDFGHDSATTAYHRQLDLSTALAETTYSFGKTEYHRTVFASQADNLLAVHLTCNRRAALSFRTSYVSPLATSRQVSNHQLSVRLSGVGQEGIPGQVKAECRVRVVTDGDIVDSDSCITVANATSATIYLVAATNVVNYHDLSADPVARNNRSLAAAQEKSYRQLMRRHLQSYRSQYERVALNLRRTPSSELETDKRVQAFEANPTDLDLIALMMQYGRYLLISSSQPGGQPANLQGVWNDKMDAPWDSKYTININAEMNYWPALVANLAETQQPFFRMIKDLSQTGAETARTLYGCRGWVAHHNTDLWRIAGPVDGAAWGIFPTGGAWLTTHLWQHYLFTGDRAFLAEYYPVMRGAADFLLDFLQVHPRYGWLVTVPTVSPEHGPQGRGTPVTAGSTMDNQIVHDVLCQTLQAMHVLAVSDTAYVRRLSDAIAKLPPMQIGRHGQLQEWLADADDPTDEHRHVSHLYGLYPSNQVSPFSHPDLFAAAATTLRQRGDMATGWSLGWKVNFWARLLDGNHAFRILKNLLHLLPEDRLARQYPAGRTYPNLFDAHPPFQIDGNFGCAAGICEMLLQSHDGAVHILPALPDEWQQGAVRGLRARGGFIVDIQWEGGRPTALTVRSTLGGTLRLRSYWPLSGRKLRAAKGPCPNSLFAPAEIATPRHSQEWTPEASAQITIPPICEYDVDTQAGHTYRFRLKE